MPGSTTEKEQIESLIEQANGGDRNALEQIIEKNMWLVRLLAGQTNSAEIEDLLQEGIIGLQKACKSFNPAKRCKFSTYAFFWVKSMITRYQQKTPDKICPLEKDDFINSKIQEDLRQKELSFSIESILKLAAGRQKISGRDLQILQKKFGLQGYTAKTFQEIAEEQKMSKQRICQIVSRVISKIKTDYGEELNFLHTGLRPQQKKYMPPQE